MIGMSTDQFDVASKKRLKQRKIRHNRDCLSDNDCTWVYAVDWSSQMSILATKFDHIDNACLIDHTALSA